MLLERHLNLYNIITSCLLTAVLTASLVSNRWMQNARLQTYEGIWRDCQEISFGLGSVCAPFPAKNAMEDAIRVLMVLAVMIASVGCIGLTIMSVNVKYVRPVHVYVCSFVSFVLLIIAVPMKTYQLVSFMDQAVDNNYVFGWSFYMGWVGTVLAVFFPLVGIVLLKKLSDSDDDDRFDEQSDDLVFERF